MTVVYYFLSLISGMVLTLQAGVNGQLRSKIGNPVISSFISFLVGTLGLGLVLIYTIVNGTYSITGTLSKFKEIRWWMFTGGLWGAFYIFVTIFSSSKIGFASMFSLVICGQILLSITFDHFGFWGTEIHRITPQRIFGVLLLITGAAVIKKF